MNNLNQSVPSFEPEQKEIIRFHNKVKFFQHVKKFKDTFEKIKLEKIPEQKRIETHKNTYFLSRAHSYTGVHAPY